MDAIRIRKTIDSETLHLPELRPLLGHTVEIIVLAEGTSRIRPGAGDWDAAMKAVEQLENYNFDAFEALRKYDLLHAKDHLP